MRKITGLILGVALWALYSPASATIIGGAVTGGSSASAGGVFQKLFVPFTESTPNNTVGNDNFQSHNLFGFDEGQNITITSAINVDFLASTGASGVLSAGTVVASHYIVYDPTNGNVEGTVDFDSDILAVISTTTNLAGSDFLINTGVNYLNPGARGLEGADSFSVNSSTQIGVDFVASSPGDVIRVLTAFSPAAVPEPPASLIFGFSLLAMGGLMTWRRRAEARAR